MSRTIWRRALLASGVALAGGASVTGAQVRPPTTDTGTVVRTARLIGATIDTTGVPFSFGEFIDAILARHPVTQQARTIAQAARAELRTAWGAFDPTLSATWDQKRFQGSTYYNYVDAELKIPTGIGADVTLAFDRTLGRFFNPDRRTTGLGTFEAGVSIPLGQGIITDARRNALQQARATAAAGEADQLAIVNKLLFSATKDYGAWYETWRRRLIAEEGEALARFRLQAVRQRVANGESPPIDTVEAVLEVQRREVTRFESEANYYVATLTVTAYLWDDIGRGVALPDSAKPVLDGIDRAGIDSTRLAGLLDVATRRNPDLLKVQARIRGAEAQRLLTFQGLLPFAEAKLSGLTERGLDDPFFDGARLDNNYKAGLTVRTPLLYLRESGRFAAAGQRLEFQRLEYDRLRRDVEFDARAAIFDLSNLERLLVRQRANVRNAGLLRDAEQIRFENGESTLLFVNIRERLVLDESIKLASIEAKVASARGALAVATGDRTLLRGTRP
ncbi:MAG: TolC family protein [Gemmatimonadaceae bacterium]|jgi:outer membrane protein TolC|nr:TolC family protein [Gemmatimonadaceae bacterium]